MIERGNLIAEGARISYAYLCTMLDDLFKEMEKTAISAAEYSTIDVIRNQFRQKIPFKEKVNFFNERLEQDLIFGDKKNEEGNKISESTKEIFRSKMNEIVACNDNIERGLSELARTISKSTIPKEEKTQINNIIKEARYSLSDPCISQISKDIYMRTMQLLNENGLTSMVRAEKGTDGFYYLMFTNDIKDIVQNIEVKAAYSLGRLKEPSKKELDRVIWATTEGNIPAELVIHNVSKELSQKLIREGNKKDIISFARVKNADNTYNIYCDAGREDIDRDKIYSELQKVFLYCSSTLTGIPKETEMKRMKEYFKVSNKIDNVLAAIDDPKEDSLDYGYVFSVSANDGIFRPNDYIKFDRDKFTIHNPNGKEQTLEKTTDYEFRYLLERNIKSGTGTKIYLTQQNITDLYNNVDEVKKILQEHPTQVALDAHLLDLQQELLVVKGKNRELRLKGGTNEVVAIRNEISHTNAAKDALTFAQNDKREVNTDYIKEGLLSEHLQDKLPHVICYDKEVIQATQAQNRFFKWCLTDFEEKGQIDFYNGYKIPKLNEKAKEYKMADASGLLEKIDKYKLEEYSSYLMSIAKPDIESNEKEFTLSNAREEFKYLQDHFEEIKADMKETIEKSSISMEQVCEPVEVEMGIDRTASILNKLDAEKAQVAMNSVLQDYRDNDLEIASHKKGIQKETDKETNYER